MGNISPTGECIENSTMAILLNISPAGECIEIYLTWKRFNTFPKDISPTGDVLKLGLTTCGIF